MLDNEVGMHQSISRSDFRRPALTAVTPPAQVNSMNSEGTAAHSGLIKVGDKLVRVDGTLIDTLTDGKLSYRGDAAAAAAYCTCTALPPSHAHSPI